MFRSLLLAGAGALALVACGQTATNEAATTPAETPAATPALPTISDADFMQQVANSDSFEVQAGQIAATNASAANVKAFAREMVTAHTTTTNELKAAATSLGQTAPAPSLAAQQTADLTALRAARAAFDTLYVNGQISAHQQAVQLFQNYIAGAPDGALKSWANTTLPKLQAHLASAQALAAAPTTP